MSKKQLKEFNLEEYSDTEVKEEVEYKPDEDIILQAEVASAMGLPGLRKGTMNCAYGLSNSGKTSLLIHAAVEAQKQGVIPIMIITENKMDWDRARRMGLDTSKSGMIIREDLEYLEDVFNYISQKIEDVRTGKLPRDVLFLWDSVASTPSRESLEIDKDGSIKKKYGPQKNAAVIGYYNPIIMKRLTSTRRTDSKGTATLLALTQAYVKPAEFAGGMATIVPNGGEKIWFPLSLCLEVKEGKRLEATVNGGKIVWGTVCKIKVAKNHISDTSGSGEFIITGDSIIANEPSAIEAYKKANKDRWGRVESFDVDTGEIYE